VRPKRFAAKQLSGRRDAERGRKAEAARSEGVPSSELSWRRNLSAWLLSSGNGEEDPELNLRGEEEGAPSGAKEPEGAPSGAKEPDPELNLRGEDDPELNLRGEDDPELGLRGEEDEDARTAGSVAEHGEDVRSVRFCVACGGLIVLYVIAFYSIACALLAASQGQRG